MALEVKKIILRKGNTVDIPVLAEGEPGFVIDTSDLIIGSAGGTNIKLSKVGHTHTVAEITNLGTVLAGKQNILVSGTNIKTVNGVDIIGEGDVVITGAGVSKVMLGGRSGSGVLNVANINDFKLILAVVKQTVDIDGIFSIFQGTAVLPKELFEDGGSLLIPITGDSLDSFKAAAVHMISTTSVQVTLPADTTISSYVIIMYGINY